MAEDKVIRDPVHNYIPVDSFTRTLLDTPEVQRLRYISQLGVSSFAYPGACHTRLSHAIGTYHLMNAAIQHLLKDSAVSGQLDEHCKQTLRAAALLHDIGHAPFSHLLESTFGGNHEDRTCRIIRDANTHLGELLAREGLADDVANLIDKEDSSHPLWMKSLLSSQLDVDRMDYLLRDSHFTGAGYGRFDWFRLVHTMKIDAMPGSRFQDEQYALVWPHKAIYALEEYIFARYYMYSAVYYHKTTRGYEKLLQQIMKRADFLIQDGFTLPVFGAIEKLLTCNETSNDSFIAIRDADILAHLTLWRETTDSVLADLTSRFLDRRGFKVCQIASPLGGFRARDKLNAIEQFLVDQGGKFANSPASYILEDEGGVHAYHLPYESPEPGEGPPQIIVENSDGSKSDIATVSERLQAMTGRPDERFTRYYYPEEFSEEMVKILNS